MSGRTPDVGDPWGINNCTDIDATKYQRMLLRTPSDHLICDLTKTDFGAPSDITALVRLIFFFDRSLPKSVQVPSPLWILVSSPTSHRVGFAIPFIGSLVIFFHSRRGI
jgi:hypothetical protein